MGTDRPTSDTVVLRVGGDVDYASTPRLHQQLQDRLHGTISTLVIDLTDVSFLGSAGLRALELAYLLGRERGVRVSVRPPAAPTVRRVIRMFPMQFATAIEPA
ncbi:STAS domain-containing protein [Amycolatopsis jiangsuensis]|uniref:Anti-anti-sigma factor n=1 Tax=Amycolatopsis jiangsuensis TaxID=1181879 RepID=A0A840J5S0_9PSEU|nr:STAS domain-containing protein [Amycolatopsis jiangsuensis]MBB4689133.1 anti-anti-sigma factor [Amycolatopsis jiangsuensis]